MRLEVVKGGGSLMGRKGRELVMNEKVGGRRSVEKKGGNRGRSARSERAGVVGKWPEG